MDYSLCSCLRGFDSRRPAWLYSRKRNSYALVVVLRHHMTFTDSALPETRRHFLNMNAHLSITLLESWDGRRWLQLIPIFTGEQSYADFEMRSPTTFAFIRYILPTGRRKLQRVRNHRYWASTSLFSMVSSKFTCEMAVYVMVRSVSPGSKNGTSYN